MTEMSGKVILETGRLQLAEAVRSDAPFVLDLLTQPSFLEFIGDRGVHDLESAHDYIRDLQLQYRMNGYGSYIVRLKEEGTPIGISGLIKRDGLEHADIGFAYLPTYWRCGYALEGAKALMDYGRDTLGLDPIVAITSPQNVPSQSLLERLGMVFYKRIRLTETSDETLLYGPQ